MMHGFRKIGFLPETRALKDLPLELKRRLVELATQPGMLHERMERRFEMGFRAVACEVNKVNGAGAGHDVDGGGEDEDGGENKDTNKVVLEMEPELAEFIGVGAGGFEEDDDDEREE